MNKAIIFVGLLAVLFAFAYADTSCDPDAKGVPDCTGVKSSSERFRNNWDPVHYFVCENGAAVEVPCDTSLGYDPTTQTCIPWSEWVWVPPCPESD